MYTVVFEKQTALNGGSLTPRRESGITKPMATDPATAIRDYLKTIQDALARRDSTEHPPDGGD
jgi:hypothetical protein